MESWVKGYTDSDGKTCTLWQMVKTEPEWAVNRIKEGEKAIAEVERLTAENEKARREGRMEALNAVFQINGPSRAITRLKAKYAEEVAQM